MFRVLCLATAIVSSATWGRSSLAQFEQKPRGMEPTRALKGHAKFVYGVAFSPDGKSIASAGEDLAILWDVATAKPIFRLEAEGEDPSSHAVAFAPDGKTLAVGGWSADVQFWDPATGKHLGKFDEPSLACLALAYSPDGSMLATTHDQKDVMLYDVAAKKLLDTIPGGKESFKSLGFSKDGKSLVTISNETLTSWDAATRKARKSVKVDGAGQFGAQFSALACSPAAPLVAATGGAFDKARTKFYDPATLKEKGTLKFAPFENPPQVACFSPDGKLLATGATEPGPDRKTITLWDVATGKRLKTLDGPADTISQIAFSGDGKLLAAACMKDKQDVFLWDLSKSKGPARKK